VAGIDDALHKRAEEILSERPSPARPEGAADARRLVHELQVHQIELELQNEELREASARAEDAYSLYRALYENAPIAYLTIGRDGKIKRANAAAQSLLDRGAESLVGAMVRSLVASDARGLMDAFMANVFGCESSVSFETLVPADGGTRAFVHIVGAAMPKDGDECLLAVVDITEREAIDRAAREKVALIGELQHRVKNNLTVVYSLLGIGQDQIDDPRAIAVLEKSRARVMAMSHIYEQLYRTESVLEVDLWSYLEQLIEPLLITYAVDSTRFTLVKEFQSVKLDAQRAALAGLIFSELISNATKYAYPEGRRGELRVSLLQREGAVELRVEDDGPGLPPGFDHQTSSSMGFALLRMISDQMRADLVVESPPEGGVSVLLRFEP
jgi:two-component system, sensor histidine kinase PdtaS